MITRRAIRRWACWASVALGLASGAALGVSAVKEIQLAQDSYHEAALRRGALQVKWKREPWNAVMDFGAPTHWRWLPKWQETSWVSPGNGSISSTPGEFILPLWIPAAFGLLCLYWLMPERGPSHLCIKCGYDLRGVPTKDGAWLCPECGTRNQSSHR